jgi:hypothetical protein
MIIIKQKVCWVNNLKFEQSNYNMYFIEYTGLVTLVELPTVYYVKFPNRVKIKTTSLNSGRTTFCFDNIQYFVDNRAIVQIEKQLIEL